MSGLGRPFLQDRSISVTVDLVSRCSAGLALKPADLNGGRPFQQRAALSAPPKARRDGRAARRDGLEGERCATSLWRGRRRTGEPVRADH